MKYIAIALLVTFVSGCASYSLVDANGNKVSGSMMNGAASVSSGAACAPTAPNPAVAPPPVVFPTTMTQQQICDVNGRNCKMALMSLKATDTAVCNTSTVNVRGTDISTILTYALAGAAGFFLLAK